MKIVLWDEVESSCRLILGC